MLLAKLYKNNAKGKIRIMKKLAVSSIFFIPYKNEMTQLLFFFK